MPTEETIVTGGLREAIAVGASLVELKSIDGTPFIVTPDDFSVTSVEHLLESPTRKRAKVTLMDSASLVRYFNDHKTDNSNMYGLMDPPSFVAVLDDNATDGPGWRQHTATFSCPLSPEWKEWIANDGKRKGQEEFATFIEDNLPDIRDPAGATMLEVSSNLQAKKKVNFASGIRLANGEIQFQYQEEIQGSSQKGQIQVPETFTLGIPVFVGGPAYEVKARLRFRISDSGGLTMWYDLLRPHKIIEDAAKETWKAIEEGIGRAIFYGTSNH